jgi:hypothetical protein
MVRSRIALVLALVAAPAVAAAQEAVRTLNPGDEVRVSAPSVSSHPVRGTVLRYTPDTLAVRAADGAVHAFPLGSIHGLSKNLGMDRRRSVRRSALVGLFLGTATGLVAGPMIARNGDDGGFTRTVALSGAGGAVLGLGIGAGVGRLFPRERWQSYRTPLRFGAHAHAGGGVAVSLTLRTR